MTVIIASIVNFAVVVFVVWWFLRKPAGQFLLNRSQVVGTTIQEAEKQANEASKLLSHWETNWNACEAHAKQLLDEARGGLEKFRDNALAMARTEADRIKKENHLVVKSEAARVKSLLRKEITDKCIETAGQFLGAHLTDKDQQHLVTEYMEIVGNGSSG